MIEVEIEAPGEMPQVVRDPASGDVAALLERWAYDASTTVTISDTATESRQLLIALSNGLAFVGLTSDDRQFQLASQLAGESAVEMIVGGQATSIANQFVVNPAYAAQAAVSFMDRDPLSDPALTWVEQ